jgi:hypothetical protein
LGAVLLEVVPDARWSSNYLHDMPKRDWRFWLLLVSEVVVTSTLLLHGEPLAGAVCRVPCSERGFGWKMP